MNSRQLELIDLFTGSTQSIATTKTLVEVRERPRLRGEECSMGATAKPHHSLVDAIFALTYMDPAVEGVRARNDHTGRDTRGFARGHTGLVISQNLDDPGHLVLFVSSNHRRVARLSVVLAQ